jgi:Domain of unknown function (DUF4279)
MAALSETAACLRIFGDDLDPEHLTSILGKRPTRFERKGDVTHGKVAGQKRVAKTGAWHIEAANCKPGDLDRQIDEIFFGMTDDRERWRDVGTQYRVDLYCGLFMRNADEGISLSAATLALLGDRGIQLAICLYGPIGDAAT